MARRNPQEQRHGFFTRGYKYPVCSSLDLSYVTRTQRSHQYDGEAPKNTDFSDDMQEKIFHPENIENKPRGFPNLDCKNRVLSFSSCSPGEDDMSLFSQGMFKPHL